MPPPPQRLVIVGDAHLGAAPRGVEEAFLGFLDGVPAEGDGLLVNGDLFDFWFAYRRAIPRAGIRVISRLAALARRIPVWMTGGNHDRWAGSFWDEELDIRFAAEELHLPLGGRSVLAVHGDGLAEARWAGRMIHRVIRHPLTTAAYRLLHPDLGLWLVKRFSRHLADPNRDAAYLDHAALLQREWATGRLRDAGDISLLVMGHTHRPALEEPFPGRRYLNPGAWLDGMRYAVATESTAELRQFRG
jgi:UDP-2,3-diacylglucosamine hydrolase